MEAWDVLHMGSGVHHRERMPVKVINLYWSSRGWSSSSLIRCIDNLHRITELCERLRDWLKLFCSCSPHRQMRRRQQCQRCYKRLPRNGERAGKERAEAKKHINKLEAEINMHNQLLFAGLSP